MVILYYTIYIYIYIYISCESGDQTRTYLSMSRFHTLFVQQPVKFVLAEFVGSEIALERKTRLRRY